MTYPTHPLPLPAADKLNIVFYAARYHDEYHSIFPMGDITALVPDAEVSQKMCVCLYVYIYVYICMCIWQHWQAGHRGESVCYLCLYVCVCMPVLVYDCMYVYLFMHMAPLTP